MFDLDFYYHTLPFIINCKSLSPISYFEIDIETRAKVSYTFRRVCKNQFDEHYSLMHDVHVMSYIGTGASQDSIVTRYVLVVCVPSITGY